LREEWDLTPWNERALAHFSTLAEEQRHAPDRVLEEADAILGVLQGAAQEGRWEGTLRLGRMVEGPLAVRGHWGAWAETLKREREAARQLGNRAAEAWSLHQSGTRALCLEDAPTAHTDLSEALRLRESLGDWEGAAVTRHNLDLLGGFGGDHGPDGNGSGGGADGLGSLPKIVGTIVVVATMALIVAALALGGWDPSSRNELPQGADPTTALSSVGATTALLRDNGGQTGGGGQPGGGGEEQKPDGGGQPNGGGEPEPQPAQCADAIDNDNDGFIDEAEDAGCSGPEDNDETCEDPDGCPDPPAQCADLADNDDDQYTDLDDLGCANSQDPYEEYVVE
jgi:hypothetical protein